MENFEQWQEGMQRVYNKFKKGDEGVDSTVPNIPKKQGVI